MDIKVEKGIPMPPVHPYGRWYTQFSQMEIGDSFLVPDERSRNNVINSAKHKGFRITTHKEKDGSGIRVWLVAKPSGNGNKK